MSWDPDDLKKARIKRENQMDEWRKYTERLDKQDKEKSNPQTSEVDQTITDIMKHRFKK